MSLLNFGFSRIKWTELERDDADREPDSKRSKREDSAEPDGTQQHQTMATEIGKKEETVSHSAKLFL